MSTAMNGQVERKRILVVEDDESTQRLLTHFLAGSNYDVVTANSGGEALELLRVQQFDLVLTDLAMPDVSGIQVIKAVKNDLRNRKTPIVVVTAHWLATLSQQAEEVGCDGFIFKPFSKAELLQQIQRHLGVS